MRKILVCLLTLITLTTHAQENCEPYKDRGAFLYGGGGNLSNSIALEGFVGYHYKKWSLGVGVTAGENRDTVGMPDFLQLRIGYRVNPNFLINVGPARVLRPWKQGPDYFTPMFGFQYHWEHFQRGTIYTSTSFFAPTQNNPLYFSITIGLTFNLVPNAD